MGKIWQEVNIVRWECVRPIRDRNWRMRIIWEEHCPGSGTAWFSFGPVDRPVRTFQRDLDEVTPDLTNHFVKLVIRFAEAL